ncbi:MAG: glycoside hydrolase family 97 protein [Sphingobacteriaceae bacterium]
MNIFYKLFCFFLLVATFPCLAQKNLELKSPDGNIVFSFKLTAKTPVYQAAYKGKILIKDSPFSLSFLENGVFGADLKVLKPQFKKVEDTYELIIGKAKTVNNPYHELVIPLIENMGAKRQINLAVRAFNDGLAFRYEFPEQKNWASYTLTDENSTFNVIGNPKVRALLWGNYNNSHEGLYQKFPLSEIKADTLMDLPALFEFPNKIYMAITEANLRNYAGMYLSPKNGMLTSQLSPLQGQTSIKVKASLPHHTPWRVMMISDRIGALIESNILTSLNEPTKIKDLSWLKPGKTSFHWWNGDITPDTTFAPGINFETNKYYIDFCARNQIEYHSVIGYGGFAWYVSDAIGYGQVGPHTDVTKTVPSLDMQQVCDYAKQKGVGIHVWVHWKAIYPDLEKAFTQFEKWGIKGMMVDFMERDDQEMVNIQEEILKKAAEHKLFIQFHGSFKPTGLSRTYPNEFTREGTHNYEMNKWSNQGISPDHDIDMPFTRLLAGATDYHLGGFRAVPDADFKPQYTRPLMIGTRCHMLAMYVVLESYLTMVADYPAAYEGQPGFDFLKAVPTVWDETRVLNAEVGKYVTLARRKGNDWFVGSINNTEARTISISLNFLPAGDFTASMYTDAADVVKSPNHLDKKIKSVNQTSLMTIKLASGGGQVMQIIKKQGL